MTGGRPTRIELGASRPAATSIVVDEATLVAYAGESLATALLASGRRVFRRTRSGAARGPFCNMGVCFDCVVEVAGRGSVRACVTAVEPGMVVRTETRGVAPD